MFCLGLSISGSATGTVINVPADYPTIQQGLNAASPGDTVLVAPGTYHENITWPDVNGIRLLSELGPDTTVIDGDSAGSVIYLSPTVPMDTTTMIEGFTIQNGGGVVHGGGIYCHGSDLIVTNNIIRNNSALIWGGGIYFEESHARIVGNRIEGNWANGPGGAIHCAINSSPIIRRNTIRQNAAGNKGGGIYSWDGSSPLVDSNEITGNGFGVYSDDSSQLLIAEYNYWGDASGPYHPTLNPGGLGDSTNTFVDPVPWLTGPLGIENEAVRPSSSTEYLRQNYPNPFSRMTAIEYRVPVFAVSPGESYAACHTTLQIFDASGGLVRTLLDGNQEPGLHSVTWDGTEGTGRKVASGIYFCRLEVGGSPSIRALAVLR